MDLFDILTFAEILVGTTFLGTPTLNALYYSTIIGSYSVHILGAWNTSKRDLLFMVSSSTGCGN
jgi:hypothetical protein